MLLFYSAESSQVGDEVHFHPTVISFSQGITLEKIRTYNELVTPLTFLVYGVWGKLVGTELHNLRILSILSGAATHLSLFAYLKKYFRGKLLWGLILIWLLNPYVIGFNVVVFTDVISNLLIILFLIFFTERRYIQVALVTSLMLYTRQYNLVLIVAAALRQLYIR